MSMDMFGDLRKYAETHKAPDEVVTFAQYLDKVKEKPGLAALAHKRIYDMIKSYGVEVDADTGEERYKFFETQLFGIEDSTKQIMEYFKGAALGSDVGRRFLLLFGPPSSGKSNLVSMLKSSLEVWSRHPDGAVYGIDGCPMAEEPLHLVPEDLRDQVMKELKVKIEGDLCPVCAYRLNNEFHGDFTKFKVRRIYFSQQGRKGIGTFVPSDPKCVVGDTLLLSSKGLVSFDELQDEIGAKEDEFLPFDTTIFGLAGKEKTSHFYNGGQKETYCVKTALGFEIEGSEKHPVMVFSEGCVSWVKLPQIKQGDFVLLKKGQMLFGNETEFPCNSASYRRPKGDNKRISIPRKMTPSLAKFLGYMASEGSITDDAIWFTNTDSKLIEDFCSICRSLFSIEPKVYGPRAGKTTFDASISCVTLVDWLEDACELERGAENKSVPRIVRKANRDSILAFIEGASWGDGSISARQSLMSNRYKYTSASKKFSKQMQMLLLNLGIVSSFYEEELDCNGVPCKAFTIQVTGDSVLSLVEHIRSLADKNTNENAELASITGRTNYDLLPPVDGFVRKLMAEAKEQCISLSEFRRYSYSVESPNSRRFSKSSWARFKNAASKFMSSSDMAFASSLGAENDIWLEVKTIEKRWGRQVYDLTVPETHSFCANGIISHNSQDISELIGSVDLSKIGEYGTESDPRAYRFDGELNISSRGLMEFIEILKVDIKFLYVLLTATQEKNIKTPRFPLLYCDEVILTHTNEAEYKKFVGQPENEALIDRMIVCRVKYNLRVNEEIRIYEKLLSHGDTKDIHIAPHTMRVAAMFAILSRLEDPKDRNLDKLKKMKLYNGEDVEGVSPADIPRLKKESQMEGMDGVSPRYVINRLVTTAIRGADDGATRRYITPIDVLRALKDGLETTSKFKPEERSRYEELLQLAKEEFDHIARNEVQKAFFVSFEEEAQSLIENYIDNVQAFLDGTDLEDPLTHEEIEPDEKLMRSIEGKIGIHEEAKESFRNEIMRKVAAAARRGEKFRYENHTRLREAIEKQMFEERRDMIKMTITSRTKEPEELKKINQVVKTLCDKHGYIAESANELLKYVSSMMAREK